jgi:hypothetical protein
MNIKSQIFFIYETVESMKNINLRIEGRENNKKVRVS